MLARPHPSKSRQTRAHSWASIIHARLAEARRLFVEKEAAEFRWYELQKVDQTPRFLQAPSA